MLCFWVYKLEQPQRKAFGNSYQHLRRLSAEELMLLNCGVGEASRESLGLQGDPTTPF